jgi:hypothetical protein
MERLGCQTTHMKCECLRRRKKKTQAYAAFTHVILEMNRLCSKIHGQYSQQSRSTAKIQNLLASEIDALMHQKVCQVSGALPDLQASCQHTIT